MRNSHRLLRALQYLLNCTAKPGLERVHAYLKGPEAWLRAYVDSGQLGAFVEYQCGSTVNRMLGPPPGYPRTEPGSDNPIVVALRATDGLEEKLRSCHQIDGSKTPESWSAINVVEPKR
jgi:hypothetical protein